MSHAADRLSRLRRDLRHWRDAMSKTAEKTGDPVCVTLGDVVEGVDHILERDQARIGKRREEWD